ncbi:uncharacterized protein L199_005193 [Kwoniella botswanensis]|uniref:uncharacterized protein n=1 Tax=Kwoniella botswanensis TaxID=1268659 RepID=UPI00315D3604
MTDPPRAYRAGLGLPQAVIIRSSPGPLPTPSHYHSSLIEDQSTNETEEETIRNAYRGVIPKETIWKEWNVNPTSHGPAKLVLPPKFVISSTQYDELGRSSNDGVDVLVDKGKTREEGEKKESGRDVADWYMSLAKSRSGSGTPANVSSTNTDTNTNMAQEVKTIIQDSTTQSVASSSTSIPTTASSSSSTLPSSNTQKPLRVHSRDWFIRRALLHSSSSTPVPPSRTTSIGNLLKMNPSAPVKRQYEPQYVLGPENKGYEILKDRLGWHGGGLGKPDGWEASQSQPEESGSSASGSSTVVDEKGKVKEVLEIDDNGQPIIDLTLDSDEDFDGSEEEKKYGPGRTAPIPTMLKLDRKGLGHTHNSRNKNIASLAKKVTHSHKEIEDARRRSQYGRGKGHGRGLELGKKGKVKWKERDKKDRDERRAIKAALG